MKVSISKTYGARTVFQGFALEIAEGEILCVVCASGCGKTTLLKILAGLTECEGSVETLPSSFVFQEPRLIPNLTIDENLRYVGGAEEEIDEILKKTELFDLRNKYPKTISGGEKQRASFARAFLTGQPLMLLDEPFSSLDTALKIRLANVFAQVWKEKRPTAVFVTHDLEDAWMLAHRVVVLKHGKIVADERFDGEIPRRYGEANEKKQMILQALLGE